MNWLDALLDRGREAKRAITDVTPVTHSQPDRGEVQVTWAQTRHADLETGDPGAVIVVHYTVEGNTVALTDESGRQTGHKSIVRAGETAIQIAKRMALAKWSATTEPFNRPLKYQPIGTA